MSPQIRFALVLGGLAAVACGRAAEAGHFFHKGTPPPGPPRYIEHTHARAGYPQDISHHARLTYTPDYVAYYVGGGSACLGGPRCVEEGTWGRDYQGLCLPRHVRLGWSHGLLYQGGTGAYDPDGPFVPDVIGLTAAKIHNH